MKRNKQIRYLAILILTILSFSVSNSFSQSKVQLGPFWGQGIRMITGNDEAEVGFGYHGGIMARIPFDKIFSIVPSVSIARKGYYDWSFGWWGDDFVNVYNQKLTYLDFYIPFRSQVTGIFYLQAGFQVGVLLDGKLMLDSYDYSGKYKKNIKNDLNSVDFGFIVGGGVQFKNGIGLELIINQGLTSVYDGDPPIYSDTYNNIYYNTGSRFDGKNFLATINVNYLFGYAKPAVK